MEDGAWGLGEARGSQAGLCTSPLFSPALFPGTDLGLSLLSCSFRSSPLMRATLSSAGPATGQGGAGLLQPARRPRIPRVPDPTSPFPRQPP